MKSFLQSPDRWQTQAAERVTVELTADKTLTVQQQVSELVLYIAARIFYVTEHLLWKLVLEAVMSNAL